MVSAQAIARYRALAAEYARQFGYAGYAIREVSVNARMPPGSAARSDTDPCRARNTRSQNCISVNEAIETMIGAATRHTSR